MTVTLAALATACLAASSVLPTSTADRTAFPKASGPLELRAEADDDPTTTLDMVHQYALLTGQYFVISNESRGYLETTTLGLDRSLSVPPDRVQISFETILRQNGFLLSVLTTEAPRLLSVMSLNTGVRNTAQAGAIFVSEDDLATATAHPAMLFTTAVRLPNLDVRQVSNSMRTMIVDANTQQMLPMGNTNTMILTGCGDHISSLAEVLRLADRENHLPETVPVEKKR